MNKNEVLNNYREKMDKLKSEADGIKQQLNNGSIAENMAKEKISGIREHAKAEQESYKESYQKAIEGEIEEIKERVASSELPRSVAGLDELENVSKTEVEILAEKHENNYFAQKKLQEVARKEQLPVKTNAFDVDEKINTLQQKKEQAHRKFSRNPLEDGTNSSIRNAMGL